MDDLSQNRGYPRPAPLRSAAVDAERVRAALDMIDADIAAALRAATLEAIGRVLLAHAGHIAARDGERVPTAAAVEQYVDGAIANLVETVPEVMEMLEELRRALGDDLDFAATITNELAKKADKQATAAALADRYTKTESDTGLALKHSVGAEVLKMLGIELVGNEASSCLVLRQISNPTNAMSLMWDGNIYGAAFGGYLTNWVNSLYQDVRSWVYGSFVTDIRLAGWWEAGLGPNSWNYDPGSGAVITALYAAGQTSGGAAIAHRGGRFLQKCIGGGWYTVGSGG